MRGICAKLKPTTCLESVAGETTGQMLDFMGFRSTVILYGLLSDKPAGGINVISFIGKAQTVESFLLNVYMGTLNTEQLWGLMTKAQSLYSSTLSTVINARYGLHQIEDAIKFYLHNQTAGKVVIKPDLTPVG